MKKFTQNKIQRRIKLKSHTVPLINRLIRFVSLVVIKSNRVRALNVKACVTLKTYLDMRVCDVLNKMT